ncbi:tape measure protein [Erwinia sp.]|uniref:tape measure protein n=1 Tax=Erwinia citreus TaxID=558 RepID=UPI003C72F768
MGKFTVSEFVIEVGFQEKVTKGLERLEKKVLASSQVMESRLNKVFKNIDTAPLHKKFVALEKHSKSISQNISKNLEKALNKRVNSSNVFTGLENDARAAVRRVNGTLGRIRPPRVGGNGNGTPAPNTRPPRNSPAQRLYERFNNSAQMRRLEVSGGRNTLFAREVQSRAANAMLSFGNDTEQLRRYFAVLQNQVREHAAATRRDTTEINRHQQAEQRERTRATVRPPVTSTRSAESSTMLGTLKGVMLSSGILFAIQKAGEIARESYKQGSERSQTQTMMSSAFGKDAGSVEASVKALANKYGLDETESRREIAILRNTMPHEKFSNDDLLAHMENLSVFSHATGVNQEAQGRANYAISQISGSAKINKQDINQLTNAIPEALKITAQAMGKSKRWLIDNMKDIDPAVFLKNFEKGMKDFNTSTGAAVKAQESIQAQQGRLANAWNNDLVSMFAATGTSVGSWMDVLTSVLIRAEPVFIGIGKSVAYLSDRIKKNMEVLDGFKKSLDDLWSSLSPESQKALSIVGKFFWNLGKSLANLPYQAFEAAIDKMVWFINWLTNKDISKNDNPSDKYGDGVIKDSFVEKMLDWMDSGNKNYERVNSDNPSQSLIDNLKSNLQTDYSFKSTDYLKDGLRDAQRMSLQQNMMQMTLNVQPAQVQAIAPVTIEFDKPSFIHFVQSEAQYSITNHSESQLMSSQGLGGGWQTAGQNAGFTPSLLKSSK